MKLGVIAKYHNGNRLIHVYKTERGAVAARDRLMKVGVTAFIVTDPNTSKQALWKEDTTTRR